MSIAAAIGYGLFYWFVNLDAGYLFFALGAPMAQGFIWGSILGNIPLGMQCGATIQLVYLGVVAVGANLPSDSTLASVVAIPIAIMGNMTPQMALTIAVPFGILGTSMDNARRIINGVWNRRAHKHADQLNYKGIYFDALIGPILVSLPIRVIPVAAVMYLGAGNADKILAWLPTWLSNGFQVLGGVLPALGMCVCIRMIGRRNLLPYAIIGYFTMQLTHMSVLVMAIYAAMIAVLHVSFITARSAKND